MKARDENVVSSFSALDDVLGQHHAVWEGLPAFAANVVKFRTGRTNINALIQAQTTPTHGVTLQKADARQALMDAAFEVAGCVFAFASETGNEELRVKVDYSESDLRRFRDGEVGPVCQGIHDLANGVVDQLGPYGVDAGVLAALQGRITEYEDATGKPRAATSTRKAAGESLDAEIASTRKVVEEKLDKLASKFKVTQPDFFREYMAARVIVDQPGGHKAKNGNGNGNGNGHSAPPA